LHHLVNNRFFPVVSPFFAVLGFAVIVSAPASASLPVQRTRWSARQSAFGTTAVFIFKQAANTAMDTLCREETSIWGETPVDFFALEKKQNSRKEKITLVKY
jgi:hypothetical protein